VQDVLEQWKKLNLDKYKKMTRLAVSSRSTDEVRECLPTSTESCTQPRR